MQTYEDLDTLADGLRFTIDWIVSNNTSLRGEVAEAMATLRETINMRCLNEEGRVALISQRITAAHFALITERQPTQWLDAAIQEVSNRPVLEAPPDLALGSIEAHAAVIVTDDPELPWTEPAPPEDVDDDEEPEEDGPVTDPRAYILGLQAQLRANKIEPIAENALDYVQAVAESLVFGKPANPPHPEPEFTPPQTIDGVTEV